jgi:hypothetical protein
MGDPLDREDQSLPDRCAIKEKSRTVVRYAHTRQPSGRRATVLAAGSVVGGLLGKEVFSRGHPDGWLEWLCAAIGAGAAVVLVASVIALFVLRRLAFSMDARATYAWRFNNGITVQPLVDLEIADRLAQAREENDAAADALRQSLHRALGSLVVLTAALATGAALAS